MMFTFLFVCQRLSVFTLLCFLLKFFSTFSNLRRPPSGKKRNKIGRSKNIEKYPWFSRDHVARGSLPFAAARPTRVCVRCRGARQRGARRRSSRTSSGQVHMRRPQKIWGPNTGGLSDFVSNTGGLSDPPLKIRGFIFDIIFVIIFDIIFF